MQGRNAIKKPLTGLFKMERKTRLELATVCLEGRFASVFTVFTDFIKFIKSNKINTFVNFIIFTFFISFIKFIKIGWKNGGKIFL